MQAGSDHQRRASENQNNKARRLDAELSPFAEILCVLLWRRAMKPVLIGILRAAVLLSGCAQLNDSRSDCRVTVWR